MPFGGALGDGSGGPGRSTSGCDAASCRRIDGIRTLGRQVRLGRVSILISSHRLRSGCFLSRCSSVTSSASVIAGRTSFTSNPPDHLGSALGHTRRTTPAIRCGGSRTPRGRPGAHPSPDKRLASPLRRVTTASSDRTSMKTLWAPCSRRLAVDLAESTGRSMLHLYAAALPERQKDSPSTAIELAYRPARPPQQVRGPGV